jgi:Zn-dependent alcohol dehydrogenase
MTYKKREELVCEFSCERTTISSATRKECTVVYEEGNVKAGVYNGPRDVSVKNVPDAKIERPTDVLVRITTTNICGSDLHMFEGRTD